MDWWKIHILYSLPLLLLLLLNSPACAQSNTTDGAWALIKGIHQTPLTRQPPFFPSKSPHETHFLSVLRCNSSIPTANQLQPWVAAGLCHLVGFRRSGRNICPDNAPNNKAILNGLVFRPYSDMDTVATIDSVSGLDWFETKMVNGVCVLYSARKHAVSQCSAFDPEVIEADWGPWEKVYGLYQCTEGWVPYDNWLVDGFGAGGSGVSPFTPTS